MITCSSDGASRTIAAAYEASGDYLAGRPARPEMPAGEEAPMEVIGGDGGALAAAPAGGDEAPTQQTDGDD